MIDPTSLLVTAVCAPLVGALLLWLPPPRASWAAGLLPRAVALLAMLVSAVAAFALAAGFYATPGADLRGELLLPWYPAWGMALHLGVDGVAASLLALSGLIGVVAVLASAGISNRVRAYHSLLLLLMAGTNGVFATLDWVSFYIAWEVMLIPMFLLIAIWGGEQRRYAALKFLLYTMAGSVLMLVLMLGMHFRTPAEGVRVQVDPAQVEAQARPDGTLYGLRVEQVAPAGQPLRYEAVVPRSFDLLHHSLLWNHWRGVALGSWALAGVGFLVLYLAFAVKVPVIPFHTWLPHAHVQAPTAISVILAGILLKLGVYGFYRLAWPLFPAVALDWGFVLGVLGVVNILAAAWIALMQDDLKRLVAYSSVSHMGFCLLGLAAATPAAISGSLVQAVTHGLGSAMLFLLVGVIYDRVHHRRVNGFGGLAGPMPRYAGMFLFACLGAAGLPGLAGFVGEVLVVLGCAQSPAAAWAGHGADAFRWLAVAAAAGVIMTAAYLLWMYKRVFTGPVRHDEHRALPDLSAREWATLAPLAVLTLAIGVYPALVTRLVAPGAELLARHLAWVATVR
ncbi:MAG: NADH-quinone oxidoreductase subunit M [Planctomycetes bacterium]|nr:NADH-quinone oxidoreductase subunit M [Planctomycetota bacterium]